MTTLMKFMETQPMSMPQFSLMMLMPTLPGATPMATVQFLFGNQLHVDQNQLSGDQKATLWPHGLTCSPTELKSPTTSPTSCSNTTRTLTWMALEVSAKMNSEFPTQKWLSFLPMLKWTSSIQMAMVSSKEMNWRLSQPCLFVAPMSASQVISIPILLPVHFRQIWKLNFNWIPVLSRLFWTRFRTISGILFFHLVLTQVQVPILHSIIFD